MTNVKQEVELFHRPFAFVLLSSRGSEDAAWKTDQTKAKYKLMWEVRYVLSGRAVPGISSIFFCLLATVIFCGLEFQH